MLELGERWQLNFISANVLALGAVADFGAINCQSTAKADAMHNV